MVKYKEDKKCTA